jgi:hypothetical protein
MAKLLSCVLSFLKANPALAGGVFSALLTLAAGFGLHLTAGQLAMIAALVTAASHGTVHVLTGPAGKHEAGPREEHG